MLAVDVDFLLKRIPNTPEKLKVVIEEIIMTNVGNDFVTFEVKNIAPISIAKEYMGIGATIVAHIKNTRTPFNIDFGVGDVIVPKQEKRKIPTQLKDFESPTINTYSIETVVAEKLDAILDLMEFSSRMKDYYDIYYLASHFDFDGSILCKALTKTFKNRNHVFKIEQLEQITTFDTDDAMQKKWTVFVKKTDTNTDDFRTVLSKIKAFLSELFAAATMKQVYEKRWHALKGEWE